MVSLKKTRVNSAGRVRRQYGFDHIPKAMSFSRVNRFITLKSSLLFVVLVLFLIGLVDYMIITEKNGCEMTFMFQFPQFVLIPLSNQITLKYPNYNLFAYGEGNQITLKYPNYNLFAYGEGHYAETLRDGHFNGVPVVFVPGNGGSYKQVRSLGSVALRMSDKYSTFHFNYFAIDFNEEYSGVNSYHLQSQTLFLKESLLRVMDLYEKRGRNVSLVLIGHSIGGLIIRSLLTLPEFEPYGHRIDLVITLATPHKSAVVPIDSKMTSFYKEVEEYWDTRRVDDFGHMNVISIGGGFNDKLVRSHLTTLDANPHVNDLNIVSTAIDDVWVSIDHVCIVWCKQLVLKLTRLLFDLTDQKSLKLIDNTSDRNTIIRYHFMERTLGKNFPTFLTPEYIALAPSPEWSENFDRIIKITKPKVLKPNHILLPLMRRESIVIQFEGHYRHDWLMACSATKQNNITFCDKGLSLHSHVRRLPSQPRDIERRLFTGQSSLLLNQGFTHLLLAISASTEPIDIQIDRFTTSIRTKSILTPNLWQSVSSFFASRTVLDIAVSEETTFYNVSVVGLEHWWHTYWIQLETISCYPGAANLGYLLLTVPWNRENQFKYVYPKRGSTSQMTLKLNSPKPKNFSPDSSEPYLYLLVDPNCSYKLHLKPSVAEMMGQLIYLSIKCQSIERRLGVDSNASQWNLHLTLLSLLYLSTIPTIPLLMDWINLKMPVLYFIGTDPYLIPALLLTLSCPVVWHQYSVIDINM
ncbi:unnamed protein product [Oppiella nova]|uniref:GPI inositol-deacylase n=1 Tax=Oppiella nova TaxID=334625 RepID=A0A7R9M697_9ACAR|nr:unnamed protein product [Oppiella nova]CAG2171564.1 unnamed protein product [Oppiella nova]